MNQKSERETADVSGVSVLDVYGVERVSLSGEPTASELAEMLADMWVPYVRCSRKCSRSSYCRFVHTEGNQRYPMAEVRCGVCVESLRSFINVHFNEFKNLDVSKKQLFLDAAYYLTVFVGHAEFGIGFCSDAETVNWWGTAAPILFSNLIKSRDSLNRAASAMCQVPFLGSLQHVLLVEGKSEEAFLEALKRSHLAHLLRVAVESYEGKSNKRAKRIEMLLQKYQREGYEVFLQGDADGKDPSTVFFDLVRRGLITEQQVFVFSYDFETAAPTRLLFEGLRRLGHLEGVCFDDFLESARAAGGSILRVLSDHFSVPVDSCKARLAGEMGSLLADNLPYVDSRFDDTELGRFLEFIRRLP